MRVTDKEYYMEKALVQKLDLCVERQKKNFDHVIIIDGDEGYGKSTFSFAIGYYLAWKTNKNFSVDNIYFDIEQLLRKASQTEAQVFIWDEAALSALGSEHYNRTQKLLIKILMVARKKRHFWIFNIPKFYRLNEYIAVDRSIGLIHVYSQDNLTRGSFSYYSKAQKQFLYESYKFGKKRNYRHYSLRGKFIDTSFLIDQDEYDRKKDEAIMSVFDNPEYTPKEQELLKLKHRIASSGISSVELGKLLGCSEAVVRDWRRIPQNHPTIDFEGPLFNRSKHRHVERRTTHHLFEGGKGGSDVSN